MKTNLTNRYSHILYYPKNPLDDKVYPLRLQKILLPRIRVGSEQDFMTQEDMINHNIETCCDCGSKIGEFHHIECNWERCPRCGMQLTSCDCNDDYDIRYIDKLFETT